MRQNYQTNPQFRERTVNLQHSGARAYQYIIMNLSAKVVKIVEQIDDTKLAQVQIPSTVRLTPMDDGSVQLSSMHSSVGKSSELFQKYKKYLEANVSYKEM